MHEERKRRPASSLTVRLDRMRSREQETVAEETLPLPGPRDDERGRQITIQVESAAIHIDLVDLAALEDGAAYLWWADVLSRAEREHELLRALLKHEEARVVKPAAQAAWVARQRSIADARRNVVLLREVVALLRARCAPPPRGSERSSPYMS